MTTPSKRRKLNDTGSSPQTAKSLDFFFSKQKSSNRGDQRVVKGQDDQSTPNGSQQSLPNGSQNTLSETLTTSRLTDEDFARQLQAEWDRQDQESSRNARDQQGSKGSGEGDSGQDLQGVGKIDESRVPKEGADGVPTTETAEIAAGKVEGESNSHENTLSLQASVSAEDAISSTISFDENPLTFEPSKYLPQLKQHWLKEGGVASYGLLTRCFVLVNSTQSRIKIVDTLVNFLRTIIEGDPASLLPTVWLTTNAISPPYISLELGLGGSAISKALKKTCLLNNAGLKSLYDKHGDAGDVAFEAKKRQSVTLRKPKPLSIKGVFESLVKIANSKGTGSQEFKQRIVERLLQDAQGPEESRYLVRTLCQHLRIGAVKTTMLIALSRAFLMSRPPGADFALKKQSDLAKLKKEGLAEVYGKAEELVKACFAVRPNYNDLVPSLLEVGINEELLVRCGLALHVPLRPMLGSITRDLGEMLTKLQGRDFSCEYKYDGQRAQVHCDENGKVSIFSRHLEVMTDKYPDLVAMVPQIRGEGVSSFILEGEVVAIDRESGELKAFQTLTNRARKDVDISAIKVDVCLFSFDLMYLNGESLLDRPFRERRSLLRSLFVEIPHKFTWVKNIDATSADSETVLEFFKSATEIKCEGIMVKVLDNTSLLPPPADSDPPPTQQSKPPPQESLSAATNPYPKTNKPKPNPPTKKSTDQQPQTSDPGKGTAGTRRKPLLSTYEPDKRLDSWLKVKKDYNDSFETIDLIPIAAWHGQGRKSKWWSPILLAVRDPSSGSLQAVTKCISGFTDTFYKNNKERYNESTGENLISRPSYVEYPGHPDVWFEPQEVWEMAFADITKSPTYLAAIGLVDEDRGLSMRFPRFLKVREDKGVEEASTAEFLAELWFKQEDKGNNGASSAKVEAKEEEEDE